MAREHINFRIGTAALERIEALKTEYDVTLSQVLRAALAVAFEQPEKIRRILDQGRRMG